jgi:hypothetical protein
MRVFISGNSNIYQNRIWHLAKTKELCGDKTGKVMAKYIVAACSGKQLGGAWGHSQWQHAHAPSRICKACQRLLIMQAEYKLKQYGDE